jgi:hypothetical protein
MSQGEFTGSFREINRNIISESDDDHRSCFMGMDGRVTLAALIDHLREVAPGKGLDEIGINFGTVRWVDAATDAEKRTRAEWREKSAAQKAKWERETYERLRLKFESEAGVVVTSGEASRPGTEADVITAEEWGRRLERITNELRAEGFDADGAADIAWAVLRTEPGVPWLALFVGAPERRRLVAAAEGEHFPPATLDGYRLSSANETTRVATYRRGGEAGDPIPA